MLAMMHPALTQDTLERAARALARKDPDLALIHKRFGPPPLWDREPGFSTLVHIILEQQVSLASALAAFNKLKAQLGNTITTQSFLALDDDALKIAGFSRQKALYSRELARAVQSGALDLASLPHLDDDAVRAALTTIKGIGRWSADVYLLMVLRRPDIMPSGDLALYVAAQRAKNLPARATQTQLEAMAEAWRPYRAVAARMLWHAYLSERRRE
jgi:DNA-3-methyladenine glycosylase II